MMQTLLLFFSFAFSSLVFGEIEFTRDYYFPINICFNMSNVASGGNDYSFVYRCSEDSVWKFTFTDCLDCNCTYQSSTMMGGCTNSGTMYRTFNCSYAQSKATDSSCGYAASGSTYTASSATSLGVCYNYDAGTYASYKYVCAGNSSLLYYRYTEYDCNGTENVILYPNTTTTYNYHCGSGQNCGAHVMQYTNDETCNFEDSNYHAPDSDNRCNYLITSDGSAPMAVGVCYSFRSAYYEYSRKLVCTDDKKTVQLIQWMQGPDCDDDDAYSYVIAEYPNDNYTVNCDGRTCSGKIRTYTDCDYKYQYSEVPIVWNYCQKSYDDPETTEYSFYTYMYQMTSCSRGAIVTYYFTDSQCTIFDSYEVLNTSSAGCQYELTGCDNDASSTVMIKLNSVSMFMVMMIVLMIIM